MAKRIFELARDLGVKSKLVLDKCRAEGLDIKNHMSTVSAGLAATIVEWFSDTTAGGSAVETTEHVDLAKARAEAAKSRRRRALDEQATETEEVVAEEAIAAEPSVEEEPQAEAAPEPLVETVAEEVVQAEEAPEVAPEAGEAAAPVVQEEPQPVEEPQAQAEPEPEVAPVAAEAQPEPKEEAAPEPAEPEQAAPEEAAETTAEEPKKDKKSKKDKKGKKDVSPAGPMLVPRPAVLKGPRVIRVEKPDVIPSPRRRPPARREQAVPGGPDIPGTGTGTGAGRPPRGGRGAGIVPVPAPGSDDAAGKKGKRRSPRRKAGRSADSGEKIREWRDTDLQERSERLAAAVGKGIRRHRAKVVPGKKSSQRQEKVNRIELDEPITIKALSAATGIRASEIIKRLMGQGMLATVNQIIARDVAETVMMEFEIELVVKKAKSAEEELVEQIDAREKGELESRAPVVTFLGHVDHGKTSLLDYIRKAKVASGEAGGITQHIGAYRYEDGDVKVAFLDTPGHEAFTAMRARGANMTDVVVLVVAADDGVMPQTVEAINHAKAAGVPIVVALNKSDLPAANPDKALGQLAEYGLQARQWGGDTEVIPTDAITGRGMDELVETLSLEAELLELKAEYDAPAQGYVVEAQMTQGLGATATLLVMNGTLRVGDVLLAGSGYGRVRLMRDSNGNSITEAKPSTPVEVSGLDAVPEAGDKFYVLSDIDQARSVAEARRQQARTEALATGQQVTLDNLFTQIEAGQVNEVKLVIKADVQGSIEALRGSLEKLGTDEVKINILHCGVGGINTGDITLAEASNALVIGFNVVPDGMARTLADTKGVDIRQYRVIYDIIEDITKVMEEGLAPEVREEKLGHAEVRQTFKVSRVGTIAGCFVTDGVIQRNAKVRIIRNSVVIEDERDVDSLKRFKDDAREVRSGFECGVKLVGYDDLKESDVLEFYKTVEVARKLD